MKTPLKQSIIMAWILIAGCLLALPASGFNLDSLLIKSVGGKGAVDTLAATRYYSATGTVVLNGEKGTFIEYLRPPDRLYLKMTFAAYAIAQGYDGRVAWQTDLNGKPTEMTGFERGELLKTIYFETSSFLFDDRLPGGKRYEGIVTRDGADYHQVAFVPVGTDTVRVLFDTSLCYPRIRLSDLDNTRTVTENDDFRIEHGVLMPLQAKTRAIDAPIAAEFRTDSVSFNIPFDTTIFHEPGSGEPDFRFPPDAEQVTIPFTYRNGHIYIVATVNGVKKGEFILDSGCSAAIFHNGFLDGLKLVSAGSMPAKGVGGYESVALLRSDSIQIGPVVLYRQIGGTSDLSAIGSGDTLPFGGIMGYDFLSRFPILIDYHRETITLFEPSKFSPPSGGTEVPFTLTMQVPTVKGSLFGITGEFIIDLGNAYGLLIHDGFVQQNNLVKRLAADTSDSHPFGGIGGGISGAHALLERLEIGNLRIDSLPVILSLASSGMTGSSAIAGNIGNEILDRYRILLDYLNQRLIFY